MMIITSELKSNSEKITAVALTNEYWYNCFLLVSELKLLEAELEAAKTKIIQNKAFHTEVSLMVLKER